MEVYKIVITGGPCAGKSTAMSWVHTEFTKMGYTVLFIPETATELITGGVAPWTCGTNADYQKNHLLLQLKKEKVFEDAGRTMDTEKLLIVCDRGALDNKAYIDDEGFNAILSELGLNEVELRDGYDAIFHLVSAAKGAEEFYTTANNQARKETVKEAIELDDRLISAWTGHPHLRVIDNSQDFESKMKRLIREISLFLGEPEPLEIERKFLIEYPDLNWLDSLPNCQKIEIVQTYLKSEAGETRVRQRGINGNYVYFKTTKQKISDLKRIEVEKKLTREQYLKLLPEADPTKRPIEKTRYCLTYKNQYFEIDIYPFWSDKAIVEIELSSESDPISFPPELKIIKEVTGENEYKNSTLAKKQ
ncbi:MAG: AAA family ATPase [Clostridia bacterium]|nr:AAA family ATPase [Clostridia bacterium]